MNVPEARPPFVVFVTHAVEDRAASITNGCYTARDVDFAHITPAGSKDCVEREVSDWLPQLERDVENSRIPRALKDHFESCYKAFKEGKAAPIVGTPIDQWPPISPAQLVNCKKLGVQSVEDLASANDELIGRLGMGGRSLSQKAATWLSSAGGDSGKIAEQLAAIKEENASLKLANERLQEQMKELISQVKAVNAVKSTRNGVI